MQEIIDSYSAFFSWDSFYGIISTPSNWGIIFVLIVLEGLLSADNALVLATMVGGLKDAKQKKLAIFAGIWGAYIFRFFIIGFGVYLIKFWWIKFLGALYLMWLAVKNLLLNRTSRDYSTNKVKFSSFWLVVLQIEMMDIAFSIDSVSVAFGISEDVWILFLGAIFGILMMRGVAEIFINLIEKYKELDTAAYILIGIISIKMMLSIFGMHIPELIFFTFIIIVFGLVFLLHYFTKRNI
jgi:YkoY family integral membrane protein